MLRSPTVFEDVVKTVCTTNCAWSATVRMVDALVTHLGDAAVGGDGPLTNAFPTPAAMAGAPESFYREVVRAGYRGAYLIGLARAVAEGELDLEGFATATPQELSDVELEAALLALPGVGPYAAAHIMMTLGRHSRLILDSWTRPKYARLLGRTKPVADRTDREAVPEVRGLRRPRLLALRHARLGGRRAGLSLRAYTARAAEASIPGPSPAEEQRETSAMTVPLCPCGAARSTSSSEPRVPGSFVVRARRAGARS